MFVWHRKSRMTKNIAVSEDTKVSKMQTLLHLSSHSIALHDPKNRRRPSIDISPQFPWLPHQRAGYAFQLQSVFGPRWSWAVDKRGGGLSCWFIQECAGRSIKWGCSEREIMASEKTNKPYNTDDFRVFYSKGGIQEFWMCLDERGVFHKALCAVLLWFAGPQQR